MPATWRIFGGLGASYRDGTRWNEPGYPIVLMGTDTDDGQFQVVAEVVEVLGVGG